MAQTRRLLMRLLLFTRRSKTFRVYFFLTSARARFVCSSNRVRSNGFFLYYSFKQTVPRTRIGTRYLNGGTRSIVVLSLSSSSYPRSTSRSSDRKTKLNSIKKKPCARKTTEKSVFGGKKKNNYFRVVYVRASGTLLVVFEV